MNPSAASGDADAVARRVDDSIRSLPQRFLPAACRRAGPRPSACSHRHVLRRERTADDWQRSWAASADVAPYSAGMLSSLTPLIATVAEQEGVIDNLFVSPRVHEAMGGIVLLAMLVATGWTARLALAGRPLAGGARISLVAAQVALMVQALIGIKLLDQGLGVAQLYIHYVGGLIPLGLYVGAGWVAWRNPTTQTRVTALLSVAGLLSAGMAFVIGRAYVQGTL